MTMANHSCVIIKRFLPRCQGMNGNELTVELAAFKLAMKRFRQFRNRPYRGRRYRKASLCPQALIAFKDGYLSIEADDEVVALHAKGE